MGDISLEASVMKGGREKRGIGGARGASEEESKRDPPERARGAETTGVLAIYKRAYASAVPVGATR